MIATGLIWTGVWLNLKEVCPMKVWAPWRRDHSAQSLNRKRKPLNHYWIWKSANQQNLKDPLDPDTLLHPWRNLILSVPQSIYPAAIRATQVLFAGYAVENSGRLPEILHVTGTYMPSYAFPLASWLEHSWR